MALPISPKQMRFLQACDYPGTEKRYVQVRGIRHRLIYYDLRGHYMSSEPEDPQDYGFLQDTEDLEALRKALGLNKIDILGHSYGGVIAFMYGLKYPENVEHLIFCSAPVNITDEEGDRLIESNPIYKKMR